jgi:hypothetical protein
MAATLQPTRTTTTPPARPGHRTRLMAVLGATAASLVVWVVAHFGGVHLLARLSASGSAQAVGPGTVAIVTSLAGLAAWGLLALLERVTERAATIWITAACIALVFSLAGPLTGGVTTGAKLALACMHLATAAVLIPVLRRSSP